MRRWGTGAMACIAAFAALSVGCGSDDELVVHDDLGAALACLHERPTLISVADADVVLDGRASRLLGRPELSVTEIGHICGFADTSHFSRRFKQRVGLSPSAYRTSL